MVTGGSPESRFFPPDTGLSLNETPRSVVHQVYRPDAFPLAPLSGCSGALSGFPTVEFQYGSGAHLPEPRSPRRAAETLALHAGSMNADGDPTHLSRRELEQYLIQNGNRIHPQEAADLGFVLDNFDKFAGADGNNDPRGITGRDIDTARRRDYPARSRSLESWDRQEQRQQAEQIRMLQMQLEYLRMMLMAMAARQPMPESMGQGPSQERFPGRAIDNYGNRSVRSNGSDRVITRTRPERNNHYFAEGADIPLSQEAFKQHYGIPMNVDLLKFMPGKPNDGKVTDFSQAPVMGGLGGRKDDGTLKWNDPNYHTLKYDFSRNLEQVFEYMQGMSEEQAKEFAFNFARTQQPLFAAHGYNLQMVENEKVFASGREGSGWTDFVASIGDRDMKINF